MEGLITEQCQQGYNAQNILLEMVGYICPSMSDWINIKAQLPPNNERVLAFLPGNQVWLPGKTGDTETKEVLILKFLENYFIENPSKTGKAKSPHFWTGEGSSNHFFEAVSFWKPLPDPPNAAESGI